MDSTENLDDLSPAEIEDRLSLLLSKVELMLQSPSLPEEVKELLRTHEFVEQARDFINFGVER